VTGAPRRRSNKFKTERFEAKINLRVHQAAGMNCEEFHLLKATVGLLDSSEINSDSRNSNVNPLFLRVIPAVRAYFEERVAVRRGIIGGRLSLRKGEGEGEG